MKSKLGSTLVQCLFAGAFLCIASVAIAAETPPNVEASANPPAWTGLSVGFGPHVTGNDPGVYLALTSPSFANDRLSVRFKTSFVSIAEVNPSGVFQDYDSLWLDASLLWSRPITQLLRGYWQNGIVLLLPDSAMTDDHSYGLATGLGLEFSPNMDSKFSFVMETGIVFPFDAKADKLPLKPTIARGLVIELGFRLYGGGK